MRTFAVILIGLGGLLLLAQGFAAMRDAASAPHVVVGFIMVIGGTVLYAVQQRPAPPT